MKTQRRSQIKVGKQHIKKFKRGWSKLNYESKTFCGKDIGNIEVVEVSYLGDLVNRLWYFVVSEIDTLDREKTCKNCIKLMMTGKPI